MVGYWVAFLTSTHLMSATTPLSQSDNQKCLQMLPVVPWDKLGAKWPSAVNH